MSTQAEIIDDGVGGNEGPKEAFCPLLFAAGQGATTVITDDEGNAIGTQYVRGLCTKVLDCDRCPYMKSEVALHPEGEVSWVCVACLGLIYEWAEATNVPITVPGFYSEGYCEYPWCEPKGTPPKYSRFRQVVFGQIRT